MKLLELAVSMNENPDIKESKEFERLYNLIKQTKTFDPLMTELEVK